MRRLLAVLPASLLLLAAHGAGASWSSTGGGTAEMAAATMSNATGFAVACDASTRSSAVVLTWTPSPDVFVDAYEIVRTGSNGGTSATVRLARATSSYSDAPPNRDGYTYSYTIRALSTTSAWTTPLLSGSAVVTYVRTKCSVA